MTTRALSLALDPTISIGEAARELVRYSLGDLDVLLDAADQVMAIAREHSGPDATRALEIVDGAIIRTESLRRHPTATSPPVTDRRSAPEHSIDITL